MKVAFITFEYLPFIIGGAGVYAPHVTEVPAKLVSRFLCSCCGRQSGVLRFQN